MISAVMNKTVRQIVLPLLAAMIWGISFVAQKVSTMGAFLFDSMRSFVAVPFILLLIFFLNKRDARHLLSEPDREDTRLLWTGGTVLGLFLTFAMYTQQLGMNLGADAGKAGFLTAMYVVLVPVIGILLKKRTPALTWVAVAVALVGLYFLSIKSGSTFHIEGADLLLILSAILYAFQILAAGHFASKCDPVKLSCIQFLVCAVVSLIFGLLFETFSLKAIMNHIWPILYLGVLSSGVGYTLQMVAEKGTNASVVSLLLSMESVFSALAGAMILKEQMTGREYLGAAFMLLAVVLNVLGPVKKKKTVSA